MNEGYVSKTKKIPIHYIKINRYGERENTNFENKTFWFRNSRFEVETLVKMKEVSNASFDFRKN